MSLFQKFNEQQAAKPADQNVSAIQLRDYQVASIDSLRVGFREGHGRQVLAAATGAGKSIIAMSMLDAAQSKGSRVMFICDRRVLVNQFSKHLDRHGIDHGCYMAGHWRHRPEARVQIASIQTLERMELWPVVDLVVVDEIHAVMRKSLKRFLETRPQVKVIGLTATPFHAELPKYFSAVTNVITMQDLVKDQYLVPFKVFIAHEINVKGVPVTAGEWKKDELEKRGLQIVGDVVADYVKISQQVFQGFRKTICFSSGVNHSAELVRRFAEVGLNFVSISYLDSEEYKQQVLEDFSRSDTTINGVISSDILTRGFDQTDVEHLIIAKPLRKSFSMHVQMIGRGARAHHNKEFCVVQDNSGNWLRFQDDWEQLYTIGVQKLGSDVDSKPRKEPTPKEKEAAKCPKCAALWQGGDMCMACGYVRMRRSNVQEVPGEMRELKTSGTTFAEKQNWWSMLMYKVLYDGWGRNRALAQYRERYGVWPHGMSDVPATPSDEFNRWTKRSLIRFLKSKGRR
jgi:superfamily II DNA or RNA helicase